MSINATLLGQMITFAVLIWFTMKFVWPPVITAMQDRQKRISEGLAAAERGAHDLDLAQQRAAEIMREARGDAAEVLAQANRRATEIVEEAKANARGEGERLITAAQAEIDQEMGRARQALRAEVATLALAGAEKVLGREIDAKAHKAIIDQTIDQL